MHPTDRLQVLLWEVGDVRCLLRRHDGERALLEITIFHANHIVTNAVFIDEGAAADFAIGQLPARESL